MASFSTTRPPLSNRHSPLPSWLKYGMLFVALLLLGHVFPLPVHAERNRLVGCPLESCIAIAFSNHPLLRAGEARQSAAQMLLAMRKAEWMPTFELEGNIGYFSGQHVTPFSAILGELTDEGILQRDTRGSYYRAFVRAELPIFQNKTFLGQASHAVRQAQLGFSREEWEFQSLRLSVALKVAEAYIDVLKNQKAVKAHEEIASIYEERYNVNQAKFQQGLISTHDLLTEEVRWFESKRDLSIVQMQLRRSRDALSAAMGLDHTDIVNIQDIEEFPSPRPSLEALVAHALKENPMVKVQQFKIKESAEEAEGIAGETYPVLSVAAHYGAANDLPTAFKSSAKDQWTAILDMRVPLFDGVTHKKAAFARARLEEEKMRLRAFELDIEQQVRALYHALQEQEEQITLIKKQIQQAQEALKLNRALYRQKLLSASSVHDTKALVFKLQLDQSLVVYDQHLNAFKLIWLSREKIPAEGKQFKLLDDLMERPDN